MIGKNTNKYTYRHAGYICLSFILCLATACSQTKKENRNLPPTLTTHELYEKFNMRSIFSSFGPRLKYFCESYPKNYFPIANHASNTRLELKSDDDIWVITIEGNDLIYISNQITTATYKSGTKYSVSYDANTNDWRANETYIEIGKDCKKYSP